MFAFLLDQLHRRGLVPRMSETERAALEAGDVWIDGAFFSGRPDFRALLREAYPRLDDRERAFLDGPVTEVCALADPQAIERRRGLPDEVWAALREHRFFGLGFPERYGGHGFSALAQSTVFGTLATRNLALSTAVLIPNSVGPGELLLEVGTDAQRDHYLPRLCRGDEIPCFALTESEAGSDAASIRSRGVVYRDEDGRPAIRLDFAKRYITLAPVATLIGLAIQLEDPDDLLGQGGGALGITCVLVRSDLPGVEIGRRHDPMGIPFANGPVAGRGVVVSVDEIIGGPAYAGRGWRMLMEALSGGRAVSLPAQSVAGAKMGLRIAGAYSMVRRQFGTPIGRFEGIEEPLARIAGRTYQMEAARVFTCGGLMAGHRPAVVSAVMKYNVTEMVRRQATDVLDILGGAGICRGPRNLVANGYASAPIGITVEGANILTRTLIVFGQGAIRCHPHAHALLESMRTRDAKGFRKALLAHVGHGVRTTVRGLLLGFTRGHAVGPPVGGPTGHYYGKLAWASARFALYSDLAMAVHGGDLKRKGKLTGRLADILSWQILAFAALRRFEAEGRREEDLPLVQWAVEDSLAKIQQAFEGVLQNVGGPLLGLWLRGPVLWWHRVNPIGRPPSDALGRKVAGLARQPGAQRDRLTAEIHLPADPDHPLRVLERAFRLSTETAPLETALRRAERAGKVAEGEDRIASGEAAGVLDAEQARQLRAAQAARAEAIVVDDFSWEEYAGVGTPVEQAATPRVTHGVENAEVRESAVVAGG